MCRDRGRTKKLTQTLLAGKVKTLSSDCSRCRNFVWKDHVPVRATVETERANFSCPSWCKGYIVNEASFSKDSLDVEAILRKYKLGKLSEDSGGEFLVEWIESVRTSAKTPKGLAAILSQPIFKGMRPPHVKPIRLPDPNLDRG